MIRSNQSPRLFRSESVGQSLSVYLPATLLSKAVGLARGLVLTWLMSPAQYGLLQIALLVANLLSPLCSLGLNDAVVRYVPLHETRGTLRRFLRLAVRLVLGTGAALSLALLVGAGPVGHFLFEALRGEDGSGPAAPAGLMRMAAVTAFTLIAFYLIISILKGLRMYRAIGLLELGSNASFALLALLLCGMGWNTAGVIMGGYVAAMLGAILLAAMPLRRALKWTLPAGDPAGGRTGRPSSLEKSRGFRAGDTARQMARFSMWAALAAIVWQMLLGYPVWYLQKVGGPSQAGVFYGVQLIASGLLVIAHAIVVVVQTSVTRVWESRGTFEADRDLLMAHKATMLLLLLGGMVVIAAGPWIVRVLPGGYREGAFVLPPLLLFFLLASHLMFLGIHFSLIERTRHLFVPWLLGVAGHVLFSWWLVRPHLAPLASMRAAAWAGVLGMSLALAASLVLVVLERRPLRIGNWMLIAAGYGLVSPPAWGPPAVLGVVLALTLGSGLILTAEEKRRLWNQAIQVLNRWERS